MSSSLNSPNNIKNRSQLNLIDQNIWLISAYICIWISLTFLILSDEFHHWFIIPVTVCGIMIFVDALLWLTGKVDSFNVIGILGIFGFFFFFLAPLLHVYWDYWMLYIIPPPDWRDWLGMMALFNFAGLAVYRLILNHKQVLLQNKKPASDKIWGFDEGKFYPLLISCLLITGSMQLWIYIQFGGISGYIRAFTSAYDSAFQGMGWLFAISESFPILALVGIIHIVKDREWSKKWLFIIFLLIFIFVLRMFFGGLRGSRSNTILVLFWTLGIIHFWLRMIPRKVIILGILALFAFVYIYGFYKGAGEEVLEIFEGEKARISLEEKTKRSSQSILLGDFGRSDVQALLAYRLMNNESGYSYALGRTYLGAVSLLIPQRLWPDRPPTKVKEGTDLLHGLGTYEYVNKVSTRVYGLAGEAMMNFSPYLIPVFFGLLAIYVSWLIQLRNKWDNSDIRFFIYPFLIYMALVILFMDSDNIVFVFFKNAALPFLVILLSHKTISSKPSHF